MNILNKVNENFYSYLDRNTKMLFTLKHGSRGVYGLGRAWYLSVTYGETNHTMATFSTKDDNYKTYREDYLGKLWVDSDVIEEANKMVCKMLGY